MPDDTPGSVRPPTSVRRHPARAAMASICILAVAGFLAAVAGYYQKNTGLTSLIYFGDLFYYRTLPAVRYAPHFTYPDSPGYDGQFYAQLAVEPLLRNRALETALDFAPYRSRRIFFSWTAYLLGLGRPAWILKVYALQNVIAWLVLAVVMLRWFPLSRPRNVLPWLGCMYSAGLLTSVRMSMLEGPSLMVIALAIVADERGRHWVAAALMGAAGMGRETNAFGSGLLIDRFPRTRREWLALGGTVVLVAAPFLLWTLYVSSVYPAFTYSNPASFGGLFSGYLTKWSKTIGEYRQYGWHSNAPLNVLTLTSLSVQAAYLLLRWEWRNAWWRMAAPYCLLIAVTSYLVWDGCPGGAPRVLLPITFAFNVLVARIEGWPFWALAVLGNLSVVTGIWIIRIPWLWTLF